MWNGQQHPSKPRSRGLAHGALNRIGVFRDELLLERTDFQMPMAK
jgi:hypothetical protein